MASGFDINKTSAEFVMLQLAALCEPAKNIVEGTAAQIQLRLKSTYKNYLTAILTKYSKTKSFLLYREEVPLYKFYQRLDLTMSGTNRMIKAVGIQDVLGVSGNVIISGSAGSGKSMLVRHLLLDAVVTKCRVPIFVELRQFNTFSGDLIDLIVKNLQDNKFSLKKDYVIKAIAAGHFVLFLDGYDEIAYDRRSSIREHIQNFVARYDKSKVILTSRPDPEFEGWQSFSLLNVCPLTKDQACSLIKKLPFDEEIKNRLLIDLGKDLFKKHVSFLSNPLLLTIMLLSYGQSASIPDKTNIFYAQAFEALFQRHDVLKGGFKRHFLTQLDRHNFSRLFSAFCLLSYDKHMLTFSQDNALELIQDSQKFALIDCNKDDYLKDLIESVCLLVHDGLYLTFSHRSFQEYFTALGSVIFVL